MLQKKLDVRYKNDTNANTAISSSKLDVNTVFHVNKQIFDTFGKKVGQEEIMMAVLKHVAPRLDGIQQLLPDLKTAVPKLRIFDAFIVESADFKAAKVRSADPADGKVEGDAAQVKAKRKSRKKETKLDKHASFHIIHR